MVVLNLFKTKIYYVHSNDGVHYNGLPPQCSYNFASLPVSLSTWKLTIMQTSMPHGTGEVMKCELGRSIICR